MSVDLRALIIRFSHSHSDDSDVRVSPAYAIASVQILRFSTVNDTLCINCSVEPSGDGRARAGGVVGKQPAARENKLQHDGTVRLTMMPAHS